MPWKNFKDGRDIGSNYDSGGFPLSYWAVGAVAVALVIIIALYWL